MFKMREFIKTNSKKVPLLARLLAKSVDLFLVLILSISFYPLGLLISIAYIACSDALPGGASVGKNFIGFRVISLEDGSPCSLKQSMIRNLPLVAPLILAIIPIWGVFLALLVGLPLIGFELYLLIGLDSGNRTGDVLADTTVISTSFENIPVKKQERWFDSSKRIS